MWHNCPYLLFAKEGKVEKNFKGLGIGSQNDELSNTTVEGLGS